MDVNQMTRKEFEALEHRKWDEEIDCDSIIVLPMRRMHDSGYRCMDFVAVKDGEPICLLSGGSDVIHIDGIGGYGYRWVDRGELPKTVIPSGWSIDCLPRSGLLRMWPNRGKKVRCGAALSSLEVYAIKREE